MSINNLQLSKIFFRKQYQRIIDLGHEHGSNEGNSLWGTHEVVNLAKFTTKE